MKQLPPQPRVLTRALVMLAVSIGYGCAAASPSNPAPAAIFTSAVGTANARATSLALTIPPPTTTEVPPISDELMELPAISQETLAAAILVTGIPPVEPTNMLPATAENLQPTSTSAQLPATPLPGPTLQSTPPGSALGAACIPNNPPKTGKVLEILDGDTIKVMIDGITFTVRYIGMDAPEYGKNKAYYSNEARLKNAELVYAREITLFTDGAQTDPDGRLLRYVKVGETFVNLELVRLGFARITPGSACETVFQSAQDLASANKTGLWGKP